MNRGGKMLKEDHECSQTRWEFSDRGREQRSVSPLRTAGGWSQDRCTDIQERSLNWNEWKSSQRNCCSQQLWRFQDTKWIDSQVKVSELNNFLVFKAHRPIQGKGAKRQIKHKDPSGTAEQINKCILWSVAQKHKQHLCYCTGAAASSAVRVTCRATK